MRRAAQQDSIHCNQGKIIGWRRLITFPFPSSSMERGDSQTDKPQVQSQREPKGCVQSPGQGSLGFIHEIKIEKKGKKRSFQNPSSFSYGAPVGCLPLLQRHRVTAQLHPLGAAVQRLPATSKPSRVCLFHIKPRRHGLFRHADSTNKSRTTAPERREHCAKAAASSGQPASPHSSFFGQNKAQHKQSLKCFNVINKTRQKMQNLLHAAHALVSTTGSGQDTQ